VSHNLKGRAQAQLETFSGTITIAQAHDLPEGGSPRNQNMDFSVGSVFTRQGLQNPFTYESGAAGPNGGGAAVDVPIGGLVWNNPGNVLVNTGVYATVNLIQGAVHPTLSITASGWTNPSYATSTNPSQYASVPANITGNLLHIACSGLSIPSNVTVTGIAVTFDAWGYNLNTLPTLVSIVVNDVLSEQESTGSITGTPTSYLAGGDNDTFGLSNCTPANMNAGFEVLIHGGTPSIIGGTNLNNLVITVYYSQANTDALQVTGFGLSVPSDYTPQGIVVNVKLQSPVDVYSLSCQMLKAGVPVGVAESTKVVPVNTRQVFGNINYLFGESWVASDFNNIDFGLRLTANGGNNTVIGVGYITVTVYLKPTKTNFNYVTTYEDDFGNIKTLAEDADGAWWYENVTTTPNVLYPLFTGPPAGTFASSFTASSRQYIALADDTATGNYPPQQVVGTTGELTGWNDRVSQVGPGAPPSFTGTLASSNNIQITAYNYPASPPAGILVLTASNTLSAGEVVKIIAPVGDPLHPLNNMLFNVLGTGLSTSEFEISTSLVIGSGSTTAIAASQYTYPIEPSPSGITQFPFWNEAQGYQNNLNAIVQSASVGSVDAGNVVTIYYLNAYVHQTGIDANLSKYVQQQKFPVYVYVSGTNLPVANGTQLVTSIGIATPPGGGDECYYFTFNVASSAYVRLGSGTHAGTQPGQYQLTIATVNTVLPLPGIETGDSITISGDPVPEWDNTWTVLNSLNSGSYSISQTSMTAGVATYGWSLSGGTLIPPAVGDLVTVTGTLNGNGIFNVTDAVIASVTGTSSGVFTVAGFGNQNFGTESEDGLATTSGTMFQIDPGPLGLGNPSVNPIYGNSGGGYITLVGSTSVVVAPGTRKGTVFFISRNGYWTRCAPTVQFTINENTNYILVSNIPIGPPNVVARAIVLTEAGQEGVPGASYYTIPEPVSFVYNGVTYLSSSFFINDNVTTNAKLTFQDATLLNATEVDIEGQNLFQLGELGDSAWCTQYAGRSVWGRVRNKIQNFVNMSFCGGYNPNPGGNILPLGWGYDTNNPSTSPATLLLSGNVNTYYISNQTTSAQPQLGMITQSAYQDYNNQPILQNNTLYSVRVTCRTPSGADVGYLIIDLTESLATGYGQTLGSYLLSVAEMTSSFVTYEGQLLTNANLTIPSNLVLRVWAENLAGQTGSPPTGGGDIEIARIEIFPTEDPVNLTGLTFSYQDDWESFDLVTGGNDTTTVNAEPANGAFVMDSLLYIVKENSLGYLSDTPNQEPSNWNPFKEISKVAGACGVNAYDAQTEKWAIMANQNGLYGFTGGQPVQMQLEIPDIWQAINWKAAQSIVVRNDAANKRIFIAAPMVTPNQWCPDFPVNNGNSGNNVIIFLNYDGIGTIEELINGSAIHVTIVGKIAVHDLKRKWSLWSIPTPYMAICKRSELDSTMLFCNGIASSKIYQLGSYTAGNDDGVSFLSSYCTYGFVSQEKAQQAPLFGNFNKTYVYWTGLISGKNSSAADAVPASMTFYQNVLTAPYPFVVPGGLPDLTDPATNDLEGNLDEYATRLFMEIKTTGGYFNLSRFTLIGKADNWAPLRGIGGGISGGS